jgi:hypothetical protein
VRAQQWHKLLYYLFIAGCIAAGVIWAILEDMSEEWEKEKEQANREIMERGAAGVDMMWQVYDAQRTFKEKNGKYGTLDELAASELLYNELTEGPVDGYVLNVIPDSDKGYKTTAHPIEFEEDGLPSFFLDQTGALRWRECKSAQDSPADVSCEQIEQF